MRLVLCTQHCHMIACYYGGRDLKLRGSFDTDYSDHWVIKVIQLHRSLSNCGEHQNYIVYNRGLSTPL